MPKYKLTLSYDGTHYVGWQVQPNGLSIQGSLEEALQTLYKQPIRAFGAGRTDAGVHALGQVAHFDAPATYPLKTLFASINGLLPSDIRLIHLQIADPSFHAQYGASSKIYHYHLCLEKAVLPFTRLYRHRPKFNLSIPLLVQGAKQLVGTHDFTTFTNVGGGSDRHVRTLYRIECLEEPQGIRIEFEGSGFGYKMVRNLVGLLLAVGSEKIPLSHIQKLFSQKDRKAAPPAAPARGLFLVKVHYIPI